jgi:hypothetical protein
MLTRIYQAKGEDQELLQKIIEDDNFINTYEVLSSKKSD